MMKPTIHSNGTSRQELLDQVCNAGHAIQDAMTALAKATPNGRDYYVQDPGAIKIALEEHNSQATRLQSVLDELQDSRFTYRIRRSEMILQIKRTRFEGRDRRSTVYASEINCGDQWPDALEVEELRSGKSIYRLAEATNAYVLYRSQNDEHILVLKD